MGTGKSGEYQLARIGMSCINRHLAASFIYFNNFIDMLNVQFGIDSLGKHVVGNREQIHVSGAFSVSEQVILL